MSPLSSYLRPRAKGKPILIVIAIVFFMASITLAGMAYRDYLALASKRGENDELAARLAIKPKPKQSRAQLELQKKWTEMQAERNFPWLRVFQSIERSNHEDIELLQFQPDKRNRTIALKGEAKSSDALLAYLDLLAAQPELRHVHLVRQGAVKREALETVAFEIKATLGP